MECSFCESESVHGSYPFEGLLFMTEKNLICLTECAQCSLLSARSDHQSHWARCFVNSLCGCPPTTRGHRHIFIVVSHQTRSRHVLISDCSSKAHTYQTKNQSENRNGVLHICITHLIWFSVVVSFEYDSPPSTTQKKTEWSKGRKNDEIDSNQCLRRAMRPFDHKTRKMCQTQRASSKQFYEYPRVVSFVLQKMKNMKKKKADRQKKIKRNMGTWIHLELKKMWVMTMTKTNLRRIAD